MRRAPHSKDEEVELVETEHSWGHGKGLPAFQSLAKRTRLVTMLLHTEQRGRRFCVCVHKFRGTDFQQPVEHFSQDVSKTSQALPDPNHHLIFPLHTAPKFPGLADSIIIHQLTPDRNLAFSSF
ncbi:Serine/Threonine-Protein Kinase Ulk3 [Manis pentadactyla]|nr:Serine/Threonine-Protein Kinase Ulk3 [Manis pentadactyla]